MKVYGGSDSTPMILTLSRTKFDFLEDHGPIVLRKTRNFFTFVFFHLQHFKPYRFELSDSDTTYMLCCLHIFFFAKFE